MKPSKICFTKIHSLHSTNIYIRARNTIPGNTHYSLIIQQELLCSKVTPDEHVLETLEINSNFL